MAQEKNPPQEESKWWIDRGPSKKREAKGTPGRGIGIIEKWATDLLKDYDQDHALRNVANINQKLLPAFPPEPKQWAYESLGIGTYPKDRLANIRQALELPEKARGLIVDAGYSIRVLLTGEPVGERLVDIQFNETPSLDYWVKGELVEERLFPSVVAALKAIPRNLCRYLDTDDKA
jgi:hypothetical protein